MEDDKGMSRTAHSQQSNNLRAAGARHGLRTSRTSLFCCGGHCLYPSPHVKKPGWGPSQGTGPCCSNSLMYSLLFILGTYFPLALLTADDRHFLRHLSSPASWLGCRRSSYSQTRTASGGHQRSFINNLDRYVRLISGCESGTGRHEVADSSTDADKVIARTIRGHNRPPNYAGPRDSYCSPLTH